MNAQKAREILADNEYVPLCKIRDSEFWIYDGLYIVLEWKGECPSEVDCVVHYGYIKEFSPGKYLFWHIHGEN